MKHNLRRILRLTEARTFTMRAIRAWRQLLPDWTPTLDALRELDTRPHEHVAAVRIVSEGWEATDARWDVLLALLEWERRDERRLQDAANLLSETGRDPWEEYEGFEWDEKNPPPYDDGDYDVHGRLSSVTPLPSVLFGEETHGDPDEPNEPLRRAAERARAVIIPFKVVTKHGQVLHSGETTVETPLKASFLDRLTPVKHLREKDHG